jgi:polysaccharide export outer membrane protein
LLSACDAIPSTGPGASVIDPHDSEANTGRNYLLVDLTNEAARIVSQYRVSPFAQNFAAAKPVPVQIIGVGDLLSITLFEAGQGGLFASENGARVTLSVSVASDGAVTVPYAGRIRAAGRTAAQVEQAIVAGLEGKAIQPQAVVLIQTNVSQTVVVSGDVSGAGRIALTPNGDRVLDIVARAGGIRAPVHQVRIQLVRNGRIATASYMKLMDYPSENVFVQPNDQIFVLQDPEVVTIMGAVGSTAAVPFERDKVSLMEGLAKVGGLNDNRADRTGVFVFRYEAPEIAKALRPDYDGRFGNPVPIVYRIDMGDPNAMFYAKSFPLRDKDLIYVSNSPATEFEKFMNVVNTVRGGTAVIKDIKVVRSW